jgi:hypothetical protein
MSIHRRVWPSGKDGDARGRHGTTSGIVCFPVQIAPAAVSQNAVMDEIWSGGIRMRPPMPSASHPAPGAGSCRRGDRVRGEGLRRQARGPHGAAEGARRPRRWRQPWWWPGLTDPQPTRSLICAAPVVATDTQWPRRFQVEASGYTALELPPPEFRQLLRSPRIRSIPIPYHLLRRK